MMPQAMPEAIDHDRALVHNWRAAQLRRLGIPEPLAEVCADRPTGIMSPGWCGAVAPRCSPSAWSADAAVGGNPDDHGHELA